MSFQEDSQPSQDSIMTVTEEDRQEVLYFAYGSNLSTTQMLERCPFSTPIGLGYLPGWRWFINERGYGNIAKTDRPNAPEANVSQTEKDGVWGMLYLLPPQDEAELDRHEGVPWAYQKTQLDLEWVREQGGSAIRGSGGTVRALVYVDGQRTVEGTVKEEYIARMERGIREAVDEWGLDEAYADRAMRKYWRKKP